MKTTEKTEKDKKVTLGDLLDEVFAEHILSRLPMLFMQEKDQPRESVTKTTTISVTINIYPERKSFLHRLVSFFRRKKLD